MSSTEKPERDRLWQAVILAEEGVGSGTAEIGPRELGIVDEAGEAGVDTMELRPRELEKRHLERLLASVDGSVERAAAQLGVARSTFYQKMKRLGVEAPRRPRG